VANVDVVLPVLNEAGALHWVLQRMPDGYRPIVVDNGSSDGSAEIATEHGAVVVHEPRRGFGAACAAGLDVASAEVVCFMDADGSLDPRELPRLVERLGRDSDLALGARVAEPGAWPVHARVANRLLARRLRRSLGAPVTDLGPMRACRRVPLTELGLTDQRFGWPLEMVIRAADAGWRVTEAPVGYRRRIAGSSKVTGTIRGTVRTISDMRQVLRTCI
jgi:glycosyltransferase involved in cell wall biosynthesis